MLNIIVRAFSPRNIVGCLLKKGLQRGEGVTGTPGLPVSLSPCCTKLNSEISLADLSVLNERY